MKVIGGWKSKVGNNLNIIFMYENLKKNVKTKGRADHESGTKAVPDACLCSIFSLCLGFP